MIWTDRKLCSGCRVPAGSLGFEVFLGLPTQITLAPIPLSNARFIERTSESVKESEHGNSSSEEEAL